MTPSSSRGLARGPPAGPLCKVLGTESWPKFFYLRSKKNFWDGLTPQLGAETPRRYGEFVALGEYYISCKNYCNRFKNDRDIDVQKKFWRRLAAKRRGGAA